MEPSSTFDDWADLYQGAYESPESVPTIPCPECGSVSLRLVFVVDQPASQQGMTVFWCDTCLTGMPPLIGNVPPGGTCVVTGEEQIPNFRTVPP